MRQYFNRANARKRINLFIDNVNTLLNNHSVNDASLEIATTIRDQALDLIDNTNLTSYDYERSILYKYYNGMNALITQKEENVTPKQIHYMNNSDLLFTMANDYYGNPDAILDIMSQNGIYSTDEAILKGVLMVNRVEG